MKLEEQTEEYVEENVAQLNGDVEIDVRHNSTGRDYLTFAGDRLKYENLFHAIQERHWEVFTRCVMTQGNPKDPNKPLEYSALQAYSKDYFKALWIMWYELESEKQRG